MLQPGHELSEVNGVEVKDIPRLELERTLLSRPLQLRFVASADATFAVPEEEAEAEDEEAALGFGLGSM